MAIERKVFYQATSRIPALDGVRAVAALLVMLFHFITESPVSEGIKKMAIFGQTGVDLFFVLSGFLITRILVSSKNSPTYFSHFYVRRALRIMPLYYLFLILWFFGQPILFSTPVAAFSQQIWSWLFLENIPQTFPIIPSQGPNHYWSLAVEEHFYLLWPLLIYVLPHRSLNATLVVIIMLAPLLRMIFLSYDAGVFYFTFTRMDSLAFGALVAVIYEESLLKNHYVRRVVRGLMATLPVTLILLFICFSGSHAAWLEVTKLSLMPLCYAAGILFLLIDPASLPCRQVLELAGLRFLGKISYGLYVFHPLIFKIVAHYERSENFYLRFILCFGATTLIAYASFEGFESRILVLKKYFKYDAPG